MTHQASTASHEDKSGSQVGSSYPGVRLLAILVVLNTISFLDRSILSLAAPQMRADLDLSHVQMSLLLGMGFAIFYVAFGVPIGWLVDRLSRRVIVCSGVLFWSLSASAAGIAQGFWQILAARAGVGAGEASLNPSAYSLLADAFPKRRLALALTIYGGSSGLGGAVSVACGGLLLGYAIAHGSFTVPLLGEIKPWQFVLLLSGLPGLLFAAAIFLTPEPVRRDRLADAGEAPRSASGLWPFLRERRVLMSLLFGGFAILQIVSFGFSSWMPTYLVQRFGWDIADVGVALAAGMALSFVGAFAAGAIVDAMIARGMSDATLRWSASVAVFAAIFIGTGFVIDSAWACVILVAAAQIPLALIGPLSTAIQQVTPNEYRGRVSGLFLLCGNLVGYGLGPLIPALLTDHVFGDEHALGLSIAIMTMLAGFGAAALFWFGCKPMRRAVTEADRWVSHEPPRALDSHTAADGNDGEARPGMPHGLAQHSTP